MSKMRLYEIASKYGSQTLTSDNLLSVSIQGYISNEAGGGGGGERERGGVIHKCEGGIDKSIPRDQRLSSIGPSSHD